MEWGGVVGAGGDDDDYDDYDGGGCGRSNRDDEGRLLFWSCVACFFVALSRIRNGVGG